MQVAYDVIAVAASGDHSLYVKNNGNLYAMGYNADGQLGDGTTTIRPSPVLITTDMHVPSGNGGGGGGGGGGGAPSLLLLGAADALFALRRMTRE